MSDLATLMIDMGERARAAAKTLAQASGDAKNTALLGAAEAIGDRARSILTANQADLATAADMTAALRDRLVLTPARVAAMRSSLIEIAGLPDPIGAELARWQRPNGLDITRVRVPLGVIGVIYESRPNVTADAGALCLKSGNAAILRAGSESFHSAQAILACLHAGLGLAGLPTDAVQMPPSRDRAAVGLMLGMHQAIDVIVPRGGRALIERVLTESRIPVLRHLDGVNHTYVHASADLTMARQVLLNAKMRRPAVCGATETLLADRCLAPQLPALLADLIAAGCDLRGDPAACAAEPRLRPATEADWSTEYLDAILSVRLVDGIDDALAHIDRYGSGHTEAIIARDDAAAELFLRRVDSAIVMVNASTQFADGGEFGMGAEIGISTGKLHARGPVGVEQLTSFKYLVRGAGQVRP